MHGKIHFRAFGLKICEVVQPPRPNAILLKRPERCGHYPSSALRIEFTANSIRGAELIPMERGGHLALMMNMNAGAKEKLPEFLARYNRQ